MPLLASLGSVDHPPRRVGLLARRLWLPNALKIEADSSHVVFRQDVTAVESEGRLLHRVIDSFEIKRPVLVPLGHDRQSIGAGRSAVRIAFADDMAPELTFVKSCRGRQFLQDSVWSNSSDRRWRAGPSQRAVRGRRRLPRIPACRSCPS